MKAIYLTTSLERQDYVDFTNIWKTPLNSGNQNYHNKLIRLISTLTDVEVFSLRPFSKRFCKTYKLKASDKQINNIHYHYLEVSRNSVFRKNNFIKQSLKLIKNCLDEELLVFVDVINPNAIAVANALKEKYHFPTIGVCTSTPSNISGTPRSYTQSIMENTAEFDGYICVTNSIKDIFNSTDKPSIVINGILDNAIVKSIDNEYGRYFLFAGNLMNKYGLYSLIDAFKEIEDKNIKLLLCGHHANEKLLKQAIKDDERIIYLGQLTVEKTQQLEINAFANINPTPFSEDLDRFNFPGKVIEYLGSGAMTISTKNTTLLKQFPNEIIWCKNGEKEDLKFGLERALSLTLEERNRLGKIAKEKVKELYSFNNLKPAFKDFVNQFVK